MSDKISQQVWGRAKRLIKERQEKSAEREAADDLVRYHCRAPGCSAEFYAAAGSASECPKCGAAAALNDCKDIGRMSDSLENELRAARRTIYALVMQAGGRVELSMSDVAKAFEPSAVLHMDYNHITNKQILVAK